MKFTKFPDKMQQLTEVMESREMTTDTKGKEMRM